MATFCTKCGASLTSDTGFCPSCGAPIGTQAMTSQPESASATPMQAPPPPPTYSQPAAAYPAVPPKSSGGGVLKVVLIVIAIVVGLGVLGVGILGYGVWKVAHSAHVNANGNGVTLSVPGGPTISAGDTTASESDLGVPTYPGAVQEKGGLNMNSGAASMVMAHFSTSDSMSQVVDFYKGKMGDGAVAVSTGNGTVINSGGPDTDRIMVTVGPGSGDDAGKTTIVIMHTKKK
jgi:hypothetical protein